MYIVQGIRGFGLVQLMNNATHELLRMSKQSINFISYFGIFIMIFRIP